MKKNAFFALIAACFVCTSCSDDSSEPNREGMSCDSNAFVDSCEANGLLVSCLEGMVNVSKCGEGLVCSKGACVPSHEDAEQSECDASFENTCDEEGRQVVCDNGHKVAKACENELVCRRGECVEAGDDTPEDPNACNEPFENTCDEEGRQVVCDNGHKVAKACENELVCRNGECVEAGDDTPEGPSACNESFENTCDEEGRQVICLNHQIAAKACDAGFVCKAGECIAPKTFVVVSGEKSYETDDFKDAQGKIREFAAEAPVIVTLHGEIAISEPWRFDGNDAYPNEVTFVGDQAVISGGKAVTGWTKVSGNIWKAPYEAKAGGLFVDGKMMKTAGIEWNWETLGSDMYSLTSENKTNGVITVAASGLGALNNVDPVSLKGASMTYVIEWMQYSFYIASAAKDGAGNLVLTMDEDSVFLMAKKHESYGEIPPGIKHQKYPMLIRIGDVAELLDEEGEYYSDGKDIYYYSESDPNTKECVVPEQQQFIYISGAEDKFVNHVTFKNIVFQYAKTDELKGKAYVTLQAEQVITKERQATDYAGLTKSDKHIFMDRANHITFDGCEFKSLMGTAIEINDYCYNIAIRNNVIEQIGSSGIRVGKPLPLKEDKRTVPGDLHAITGVSSGQSTMPAGIVIDNNTIDHTGMIYKASIGILVYYANLVDILHNTVTHVPYTAISTGWGWGNDVSNTIPTAFGDMRIQKNYIADYLETALDGAGVYNLSVQTPHKENEIYGLHVTDNYVEVVTKANVRKSMIYMDEGSQNVHIEKNVMAVKGDNIDSGVLTLDIRSMHGSGPGKVMKNILSKGNYTNSKGKRITANQEPGVSIEEDIYVEDLSQNSEAMAIKAQAGAK